MRNTKMKHRNDAARIGIPFVQQGMAKWRIVAGFLKGIEKQSGTSSNVFGSFQNLRKSRPSWQVVLQEITLKIHVPYMPKGQWRRNALILVFIWKVLNHSGSGHLIPT